VPAGQTLKSLRSKRNITVREVEQASRRIANAKGDKRFCISNGWLAQLENGVSEPSIYKLFSLSVIYHANFLDLIRLYNIDVDDKEKYESVANPHFTQLISHKASSQTPFEIPKCQDRLETGLSISASQLAGAEACVPHIIYGHLGLADLTMYPMIRPGSLLKIDTRVESVLTLAWQNEYERPIYFIELRDAYACGWCELQGNQLLVIPHHSSPGGIRQFTYPREAEIVGRVVGYSTSCVGSALEQVNFQRRKSMAAVPCANRGAN
jgi:transcriptional regulator with XRE-family HTH domain